MGLGFLMERRYAPYPKWFGSAFARLACADGLLPHLDGALAARSWPAREGHLAGAYEAVAGMHNALGLTALLPERVSPFWGRPFRVIHGDRFADALRATIEDPRVRRLPEGIGAIDQWVDSTDVLASAERRRRLQMLYTAGEKAATAPSAADLGLPNPPASGRPLQGDLPLVPN